MFDNFDFKKFFTDKSILFVVVALGAIAALCIYDHYIKSSHKVDFSLKSDKKDSSTAPTVTTTATSAGSSGFSGSMGGLSSNKGFLSSKRKNGTSASTLKSLAADMSY